MGKPLLSVCLITYNQADYVKQAIESILAQQVNFAWELVIADDFSIDGTRKIILDYKKKFPNQIKLILQNSNVGAEKNWLDLMKYPKSKYIAYLEGDDFWTDDNKLQSQFDFLEKNPSYSLSFHLTKVFFENGDGQTTIWPNVIDETKLTVKELLKENFIPSNSVVYRRQNYDKFPLGVAPGDWLMHLYHAQFGKIGFINKVMSAYRRHAGSMWWDSHDNSTKLWETHGRANANMFLELLKIYGDKDTLRGTINESVGTLLKNLMNTNQDNAKKVIEHILTESPEAVASTIINLNKEIENEKTEKAKLITDKDKEVVEAQQEILNLRSDLFKIRDELHALRNSRVLGKVIKLRDFIGTTRKVIVSLPRRVLHKIRCIVAPYIPGVYRKAIKKTYRKLKTIIKSRNIDPKQISIEVVPNVAWDNDKPLVSVVIPYYNRASTIDDTIESLTKQTFTDFEVLIVDDGSTETESIEKLKNLKRDKLNLKVIYQTNAGVASARNKGVSEAKGKYIVCLDSDDMLAPLFIEKCTAVLESDPDVSLVTTYRKDFGVINDTFRPAQYDPMKLYTDNMVITAAEFRKQTWEQCGGYTSGIGYEDWEYWLKLGEKGFWGKQIPEELFIYRTSMQSRYIEDKDVHWRNLKSVRALHPNYKKAIKKLLIDRQSIKHQVAPETALINMNDPANYANASNNLDNILITIPWMTFGGAETLIYNFCREIKDSYNISFITGLKSEHEWEYKFKEITPNVYHLANLFEDQKLYIEFISNYITTRKIDILHIIHNGFTFEMLPELKKRHPKLKVIVTMFNDRVEYFEQSISFETYIDEFVSDNKVVQDHYTSRLKGDSGTRVIPNGINCYQEFNKELFDVFKERSELGIDDKDLSVFFVGRLSVEKNPNVFIEAANKVLEDSKFQNLKFFIIGDGPMKPEIEDMLKESHNPKIVYLGYQTAIAKHLSAADMFVLPSAIEGFPLSILEAMAMQVAVIASDVGAVSQVVESGKTGYVVKPGSASEVAKYIKKLATDPKLLHDTKIASRKAVEKKYSNIVLGENYKKLYREVNK